MKREIKYKGSKGKETRRKAVLDALFYVGKRNFKTAVKLIKKGMNLEQTSLTMYFMGVRGFPVKCMFERYSEKRLRSNLEKL